ncbi:NTPase KAP [Methylobacterium sp. WL64]|uniref:Qat anti-phage system ATPase QatA n=1 Tax=Methylobacterium sp. WL64 TaxID=2603894 RepID=UPI0011CC1544|nr:Qat anti-phage system ATPase QatA [Methylobacterium sp. WL64]TXN02403.1 NTPase KAP [Methylobacterium sp. WL64]
MTAASTPSLGYLSDVETKVDLLNNEAIARTIVRLIREKSEHPISVGVHGDWGAGKSSVLEMIEDALSEDKSFLCLKFNGWQFQGFEDAKIALIEGVILGLIEKRSLWSKASDEVREALRSVDKLKLAKKAGTLAFTAMTGVPAFGLGDLLGSAVEWVKDTVTDKDAREAALKEIEELKKEEDGEDDKPKGRIEKGYSVPKEIGDFRKSFKKLIAKAGIERLVVLVDDLDRCLPATAIETLEAIRLFVFLDKTAFIVGADEGMIEYAVRKHFPDMPETQASHGYARAYLEKLLQVPFRIPALGETETHIYVTLLLVGATLGEKAPEFEALMTLGRNALSKPWDTEVFTSEAVKTALGAKFDQASVAILTADQISPVLSAGTKGNPRQVKRFLNALTLRLAVARERNFGDAIGQTQLAKLMLAELFLPETVFSYIAMTAANARDGICPELAEIEAFADGGGETRSQAGPGGNEPPGDGVTGSAVAEWKLRPDVIRWAKVKPALGTTSLRPYLFVIKDRKNFVSGSAPLSEKLRRLVAMLGAGEMAARGAAADVRTLSPVEISDVFKELKARVIAANPLDQKPDAFHGVALLATEHPGLQGQYVEMLNDLPADKLGFWAATGHQMVREDRAKERLRAVLTRWSTCSNTRLARAATTALAPPRRAGRGT